MLHGYIAAGMVLTEEALGERRRGYPALLDMVIPGIGIHLNILGIIAALAVVVLGSWRAKRMKGTSATE